MNKLNSLLNTWDFEVNHFEHQTKIYIKDIFTKNYLKEFNKDSNCFFKANLPIISSPYFQEVEFYLKFKKNTLSFPKYAAGSLLINSPLSQFSKGFDVYLKIPRHQNISKETYLYYIYLYFFKKIDYDLCQSLDRVRPQTDPLYKIVEFCKVMNPSLDIEYLLKSQQLFPIMEARIKDIFSNPKNYTIGGS